MYLSELYIENFRMFGEGERALRLPLQQGLTALVGENDAGKTTVIDSLRFALGTRDQEYLRVDEDDFHQPHDGSERRKEIRIRCKFELTSRDMATFVEYLTYEQCGDEPIPVLYVTWRAVNRSDNTNRRLSISYETRSGKEGDGPQLDSECKILLRATYLQPMRDAMRGLSSGRGSRLSHILQNTQEVKENGVGYNPELGPPEDLSTLSVLGVGDLANALLSNNKGIHAALKRLNQGFLDQLAFSGDKLEGHISANGFGDKQVRLRQLLEKLDLKLSDYTQGNQINRGLGSNNLLYMACEMLLLSSEEDFFPLLLIEEPEAHLHPQRQLRFMQFLQHKANEQPDDQRMQVILTTHSPNLASAINLDNLVLLQGGKAFSLRKGQTKLDESDYGFLSRFLDVTKANLFFARGVIIVEGDAENILLPTIARLLGRDLAKNGVSIVNVGGTGLRRYARIFLRNHPDDGEIELPVACIADLDVMPDCAPKIIGKIKSEDDMLSADDRHWSIKSDFSEEELEERRQVIQDKASGQKVASFVANEWTLEYDLAFSGLAEEVWIAAQLAKADDQISSGKKIQEDVVNVSIDQFGELLSICSTKEELASHIYSLFAKKAASKATAAQYLANRLEQYNNGSPRDWRTVLPSYLIQAIEHVTRDNESMDAEEDISDY